jgi:mRNA interferase MazF
VILERGSLLLVGLDPTRGHEQRGARPCVVVSDPSVAAHQRYPLIAVVPVTGTPGEGILYPRLEKGEGGLRRPSWALVDQVRSVDKRRVLRVFAGIGDDELERIDDALQIFLGLNPPPAEP